MSRSTISTFQLVLTGILLGLIVIMSLGLSGPKTKHEHFVNIDEPRTDSGFTDIDYLQRAFRAYNHAYFQDQLSVPTIDMDEERMQATTSCSSGGVDCRIKFNPAFVKAPRTANLVILHEMCHIKTWDEDQDKLILDPDDFTKHGKHWRSCMSDLDDQGAFRYILIDFYQGRGQ